MTTKVNIISNVYSEFGRPPINSLSPQIPLDMTASNLYDMELPTILTEFDYPIAREFKELTKLTTAPKDTNYINSFRLPIDMLLFLYPQNWNCDYKIMGTEVWANEDSFSIYYVRWQAELDNYFNPALKKYLFIKMCALLAYPITNKSDLQVLWMKTAEEYYGVVSTIVGGQEPNKIISDNTFLNMFRSG